MSGASDSSVMQGDYKKTPDDDWDLDCGASGTFKFKHQKLSSLGVYSDVRKRLFFCSFVEEHWPKVHLQIWIQF